MNMVIKDSKCRIIIAINKNKLISNQFKFILFTKVKISKVLTLKKIENS